MERADIGRSVSSTCGREARRDDQPRLGREVRHGAERRMACRDDAPTCTVYVGVDVTGDGRVARRNTRVDVYGSHGERLGEGRDPRWRVHDKERSGACNAKDIRA